MKTQFLAILIALTAFLNAADASVSILNKEIYKCSDGKDYAVLRHYWGGYGPGQWTFQGLCSENILTQERYQGRIEPIRNGHADIAKCQDEDSPQIRSCMKEFGEKNGFKGVELDPIIHGRDSVANKAPVNYKVKSKSSTAR